MSPHVNQSNNPTSKANSQSSNSKNPLNNAISPVKKGKLSFMEYYHSVPVKNPTNILEKYIKRKKWAFLLIIFNFLFNNGYFY